MCKFKKTNSIITLLKICDDKATVNQEVRVKFIDKFVKVNGDENLMWEWIYNTDGMSLFIITTPRKSLMTADEIASIGP